MKVDLRRISAPPRTRSNRFRQPSRERVTSWVNRYLSLSTRLPPNATIAKATLTVSKHRAAHGNLPTNWTRTIQGSAHSAHLFRSGAVARNVMGPFGKTGAHT